MKKLILSIIAVLVFSFTFAKEGDKKISKKDLLVNSKKAVEYLSKELKLKDKKLASVDKAFSKYAEQMHILNEKISSKDSSAKGNPEALVSNKKAKFNMMSKFLKERDLQAVKGFSKKGKGKVS